MLFKYIQFCVKGLRDKLFERLRRGELSSEQLIAGCAAFSFLNKDAEEHPHILIDQPIFEYYL